MTVDQTAGRWRQSEGQIVCLSPCVCVTPSGGQPVPYMIVGALKDSTRTSPDVLFGAEEAFTMHSRITTLAGNEAGTGGGVVSGVNQGWCRPVTNKPNFVVNGYQVIQNDCIFEMNCDGPEGPSNTLGRLALTIKPGQETSSQ